MVQQLEKTVCDMRSKAPRITVGEVVATAYIVIVNWLLILWEGSIISYFLVMPENTANLEGLIILELLFAGGLVAFILCLIGVVVAHKSRFGVGVFRVLVAGAVVLVSFSLYVISG